MRTSSVRSTGRIIDDADGIISRSDERRTVSPCTTQAHTAVVSNVVTRSSTIPGSGQQRKFCENRDPGTQAIIMHSIEDLAYTEEETWKPMIEMTYTLLPRHEETTGIAMQPQRRYVCAKMHYRRELCNWLCDNEYELTSTEVTEIIRHTYYERVSYNEV